MFGDALIGRSILAPVDIAPALWARFGHVDPQSNGIPTNHHVIDQLSYDLPIQWSVYHSYRRGEVPWWDPYTLCGRPLLADAHANAADPVRVLLYLTVPSFVLAYNWTLIVHHIVLGLGMFVLLRRLGAPVVVSAGLALAFQMGGTFLVFFGHPWVTATFEWYPWLWAAWHTAWEQKSRFSGAAALASAAIIFSGNLQSHAYLPIFGICFAAGYAGRDWKRLKRALLLIGSCSLVGGFIAAPVLGPELELFMNRGQGRAIVKISDWPWHGFAELAALWPWAIGTLRTVGQAESSFQLFTGVGVPILAILGVCKSKNENAAIGNVRRTSFWCIGVVVLVVCTPLMHILYMRISGMGIMGIIILAALGCVRLGELSAKSVRQLAAGVLVFAALVAIGTAIVAYVLFPKIEPKIRERMISHAETDSYLGMGMRLRVSQVARFPAEIGFLNPEIVLSLVAFIVAAATFRRPSMLPLLLLLNVGGPALSYRRTAPRSPVEQWVRLVAGSREQRELVAQVGTGRLRQGKAFERQFGRFFPMQTAHFFGVQIFDGYAAIAPPFYAIDPNFDRTLASDFLVTDDAEIQITNPNGNSRFHWSDSPGGFVTVTPQGVNHVSVSFERRAGGTLIRTDTFYPGWKATTEDGRACETIQRGVFSEIEIPEGVGRVDFAYRPSGLSVWLGISSIALLACAIPNCRRFIGGRVLCGLRSDADSARRKIA